MSLIIKEFYLLLLFFFLIYLFKVYARSGIIGQKYYYHIFEIKS